MNSDTPRALEDAEDAAARRRELRGDKPSTRTSVRVFVAVTLTSASMLLGAFLIFDGPNDQLGAALLIAGAVTSLINLGVTIVDSSVHKWTPASEPGYASASVVVVAVFLLAAFLPRAFG